MGATKTETGTDPKTVGLVKKAAKKKKAKPGKWVPICIIAMAQDFNEATGKMLMSQSKALLEQHTGTMAIRTTKV